MRIILSVTITLIVFISTSSYAQLPSASGMMTNEEARNILLDHFPATQNDFIMSMHNTNDGYMKKLKRLDFNGLVKLTESPDLPGIVKVDLTNKGRKYLVGEKTTKEGMKIYYLATSFIEVLNIKQVVPHQTKMNTYSIKFSCQVTDVSIVGNIFGVRNGDIIQAKQEIIPTSNGWSVTNEFKGNYGITKHNSCWYGVDVIVQRKFRKELPTLIRTSWEKAGKRKKDVYTFKKGGIFEYTNPNGEKVTGTYTLNNTKATCIPERGKIIELFFTMSEVKNSINIRAGVWNSTQYNNINATVTAVSKEDRLVQLESYSNAQKRVVAGFWRDRKGKRSYEFTQDAVKITDKKGDVISAPYMIYFEQRFGKDLLILFPNDEEKKRNIIMGHSERGGKERMFGVIKYFKVR